MSAELPADAYYEQTLPGEVAVSPDGELVAFVATQYDGEDDDAVSSLFVVPADGSREPHRLTRASDAWAPTWSPDGSTLAFLAVRDADAELTADRTPESDDEAAASDDEGDAETTADGDEDADDDGDGINADEAQVWAFDMELGGDARQVTTREAGVQGFDWGPAGDRIVVQARDPTEDQREYLERREDDGPIEVERLQHKMEGTGYTDSVTQYCFVVDVETREERRLDDATVEGLLTEFPQFSSLSWGEGGIAYASYDGDGDPDDSYRTSIHVVEPATGEVRSVTDGAASDIAPRWSPDGTRLAFVRRHPENWHVPTDLCVVDPERGDDVTVLSDGLDRTIYGGEWLPDGRLVGRVGDEGTTALYAFEPGHEPARIDGLTDEYTGAMGLDAASEARSVGLVVVTPDERNVYAADVHGDATADLTVASDRRQLTDYNAGIVERAPASCTRVRYENGDGVSVEGILYAPGEAVEDEHSGAGRTPNGDDPDPDEPRPLVVDIHGGPMAYDEPAYSFGDRYWVSRGYAVLKVNYRGSTSYGRAFSESIRGDWGPRETDDVVSGVEHLVDRGIVDPDRVFVTGFSQGGVNTAYVLSRSDVATAGAAQHGIYDLRSAFGTDDTHNWLENDFGLPWESPERYDAASSITDVGSIDDPLLVTAGENDHRCPLSQAEQLYVSVKKQGVPAKLVVYPDTGHEYGGPDDATHRLETIEAWFRDHDPAIDESDGTDES